MINTPTSTQNIEIGYENEYKSDIDYYFDEKGIYNEITSNEGGLISSVKRNNVYTNYTYNSEKQIRSISTGISYIDGKTTYNKYLTRYVNYTSDSQYLLAYRDEFDNSTYFEYNYLTSLLKKSKDSSDVYTLFESDDYGRLIKINKDTSNNIYHYVDDRLDQIIVNGFIYQFNYNDIGQITNIEIVNGINITELMSYEYLEETIGADTYYTDLLLGEVGDILGHNMYAYCQNNPVMYVDPSGYFLVTAIVLTGIAIGATVGGTIAYNTAKENGAEGWELVGWTALGAVSGGAAGGFASYGALSLSASFTFTSLSFSGYGTMALSKTTIAITGTQIAIAGQLTVAAAGLMYFSKNANRFQRKDSRKNTVQNREFDRICNDYGLNKTQRGRLHNKITKKGYSIEDIIGEIFNLFGKW